MTRNPKKFALAKTIVKKEIIEIESATDTDTDEVGGRMLALCGEVNASGDDALGKVGKTNRTNMQIVCAEDCDSGLVPDLEYKKYLARFSEIGNLYLLDDNLRDSSPVRIMYNIDHEASDRSKGKAVKIEKRRAGRKAKSPTISSVSKRLKTENGRADHNSISRTVLRTKETQQKKGDARRGRKFSVANNSIKLKPTSYVRDTKQKNGDARRGRKISVAKNTIELKPTSYVRDSQEKNGDVRRGRKISLAKKDAKLKHTRNDKSQLISRTVLRTKETQQKKGDARRGRKISVAKNSIKLKPTSYVRDTKQKNGDARRGRKIYVAKNTIELKPTSYVRDSQEKNGDVRRGRKISLAKKDAKLKHTRNDKSQPIFRASKRLKTEIVRSDHNWISKSIPVVNTKNTQRRKREALPRPVTKHNNESKSRGHVKDKVFHSFKPRKKENAESLSAMDKSYAYYLAYLRNSITIGKSDRQVKPVKDVACLSYPDIIAVSDHPFPDGGKSPFEATNDGKVIDLEDGIEPDDIFNSSFSKKLMEILRNPYDGKEFLRLYNEASLKRPLSRSRQLRDGREIEYNVEDQLALSYLEKYTDFNKKYHRYRKDLPRALNLLRGFFFYLQNIVLEGAFKPWLHEKRLTNLCVDARECKDRVQSSAAPRTALKYILSETQDSTIKSWI